MSLDKQRIFTVSKLKKSKKWTEDEDNLLIDHATKNQLKNWKNVASHIPSKNAFQCFSRYKRIRPGLKRGQWNKQEDQELSAFVDKFGFNWSEIAKKMENRNNKQVRDRYLNILNPHLNKDSFTKDEDVKLVELEREFGRKWTVIAKFFQARSSDRVKNRFYTIQKRTRKNVLFEKTVIIIKKG